MPLVIGVIRLAVLAGIGVGICSKGAEGLAQDPQLIRAYSAIRDLQDLGKIGEVNWTSHKNIPILVVMGIQSSGKTSFIESLVGWGVGHTHRSTATKCPVRYVLRSGPGKSYKVGSKTVGSRSGLRSAVKDHMQALGSTIASDILTVEIQESRMLDLDIVDMPGMKDRGESDYVQIANITKKFLSDPRTIPVVMCQASKSHETQHDLDVLRDLGLSFGNALVIMNYLNKQLPDMAKVSQVNAYVSGQKSKFPRAHFVMLHYKDSIDKEGMTAQELEEFNQQLPAQEARYFEAHLERMEKDEALKPIVRASFGVRVAHEKLQSILLDWMRSHSSHLRTSLRSEILRSEQKVGRLRQELFANNPQTIKDLWRNYTIGFETMLAQMQQSEDSLMTLPMPEYELGPVHVWANMTEVKSTYEEERGWVTLRIPTPLDWLDSKTLSKELRGTYTGEELSYKLGPHAAFARLQRVMSFMIMAMPLERFSKQDIVTRSGHAREGITRSFNKHKVVKQLVTHTLLRTEAIVSSAMHQVKVIYMLPLQTVHESLAAFYPHASQHREFHRKLDSVFERLLTQYLNDATKTIQKYIVSQTNYFPIDLPNRILMLFALTPMLSDVIDPDPVKPFFDEGNVSSESDASQSTTTPRRVSQQREALLAFKRQLYMHQATHPFKHIDFVEGGLEDLHQDEYRSVGVEHLNKVAEQYFNILKGQIVFQVEAMLNHEVYEPLSNKEKLLGVMREEMLQEVQNLNDSEVTSIVNMSYDTMMNDINTTSARLQKMKTAEVLLEDALAAPALQQEPRVPATEVALLLQVASENLGNEAREKVLRAAEQDLRGLVGQPALEVEAAFGTARADQPNTTIVLATFPQDDLGELNAKLDSLIGEVKLPAVAAACDATGVGESVKRGYLAEFEDEARTLWAESRRPQGSTTTISTGDGEPIEETEDLSEEGLLRQ